MAKIITKAVTRLQKFLAAIAGDAVAPTPITNQEKLLFNIAEEMKAASASDLPDIGSSDKNKYLHTNESTGALEWAEGGSGGGALVVTDTDGTLDKTWQEIYDALPFAVLDSPSLSTRKIFNTARTDLHGLFVEGGDYYAANSASGYPEKTTSPK